jgi:hypothetical protein
MLPVVSCCCRTVHFKIWRSKATSIIRHSTFDIIHSKHRLTAVKMGKLHRKRPAALGR